MRKPRPKHDAGFTMVELIAGLMVATLLIAGIVDIVRRYARTTGEVREAASDIRSARLLDAMMTEL
ncbi:MAG: prepilin-type N-terminal cleavage/methylation domain-containing protein, partial [Hyphomonadaceae bacterium]|nr:prepilin-type N-terminal cleavage/methylation domain-containing protein [Hyphomonadaceae bacterium]